MTGPAVLWQPSPNFGPRRGVAAPDMVVLHYTAMAKAEAALARLCDPQAEVSSHYLVAEDGRVWALVPEAARAWHAGVAAWGAVRDVNSHSIGIELANRGDHPFPEPQMRALAELLSGVLARWRIPPERVVGHACVAPGRKIDPGARFDWRRLARSRLAVWLDPEAGGGLPTAAGDGARFRHLARRFGYWPGEEDPREGNVWDEAGLALWRSFTDRFLPGRRPPPGDPAALEHLARLVRAWPVAPPG